MSRALWFKTIHEMRVFTLCCALVLFLFSWIFVWISSMVGLKELQGLLELFPDFIQNLSQIPIEQISTPRGIISALYVDPVILITIAVWAVARGSEVVSGEIDRGSMEMLLAQPIRRVWIVVVQTVASIFGAALLAGALLAGLGMGLLTVTLTEPVRLAEFVPATINLFCFTLCLVGISTLFSSWDRYRWQTVGLAGGFFILQLIVKVVARTWPSGAWLRFFTIFGAFEPQPLVTEYDQAWSMSVSYDGSLLLLAFGTFIAATAIFCYRDIPAPL